MFCFLNYDCNHSGKWFVPITTSKSKTSTLPSAYVLTQLIPRHCPHLHAFESWYSFTCEGSAPASTLSLSLQKFVVVEGLYRNYGDIANLAELKRLKEKVWHILVTVMSAQPLSIARVAEPALLPRYHRRFDGHLCPRRHRSELACQFCECTDNWFFIGCLCRLIWKNIALLYTSSLSTCFIVQVAALLSIAAWIWGQSKACFRGLILPMVVKPQTPDWQWFRNSVRISCHLPRLHWRLFRRLRTRCDWPPGLIELCAALDESCLVVLRSDLRRVEIVRALCCLMAKPEAPSCRCSCWHNLAYKLRCCVASKWRRLCLQCIIAPIYVFCCRGRHQHHRQQVWRQRGARHTGSVTSTWYVLVERCHPLVYFVLRSGSFAWFICFAKPQLLNKLKDNISCARRAAEKITGLKVCLPGKTIFLTAHRFGLVLLPSALLPY